MSKKTHKWVEVNGKQWLDKGDGHLVRVIKKGDRVPEEASITVPHPTKDGFRIVICILCVIALALILL